MSRATVSEVDGGILNSVSKSSSWANKRVDCVVVEGETKAPTEATEANARMDTVEKHFMVLLCLLFSRLVVEYLSYLS